MAFAVAREAKGEVPFDTGLRHNESVRLHLCMGLATNYGGWMPMVMHFRRECARAATIVCALVPGILTAWTPTPTDADYIAANTNVFLDEVARIDVTIDPAEFQDLLDNPRTDVEKPVTMRWRNSVIDETHEMVGFRPRGGRFTREAVRKSWKLDFNDFVPGRAFHGLESVDLNGDHNDPTFLRRRFSHTILRQMGLPSPRTHFAALYINGQFWSIQIHAEHIDEEFAGSWFGNKDGNLYKCLFGDAPADLRKVDGEDYRAHGNGTTYEETNNEPLSDYTDLVMFIRQLNDTTAPQRLIQLESYINIDNVLRYLATNVGVGSWDDYWYGSNNYYLYYNQSTLRFEWVPYDYDNTVGMDYFGVNWSTRNFSTWGNGGFGSTPAPLVDALFDHSPWRQQYRRYLAQVAALLVDPSNQALLDHWHAQILPYFDGTIESGGAVGRNDTGGGHTPYFSTGINQPASYAGGSFHTMGLKPFLNARRNSLVTQLAGFSTPPLPNVRINELIATNVSINQDEAGEFEDWIELINLESTAVDVGGWHLTDDVTNPLKWVIPAGTTIPAGGRLLVWCDNEPLDGPLHATYGLSAGGEHLGLFTDVDSGRVLVDHVSYPALGPDQSFGRFPEGTDSFTIMCNPSPLAANVGTAPPCGSTQPRTPPRLFINEFMADNDTVIADELGQFDDWVEIYNDETTAVDMGGLFLTDTLANPTKWEIPAGTTIQAKGFLIFWCDSSPAQGPRHTNFALSVGGEAIGLFDNAANNFQPIDTLTFGPQTTDISSGLLPDGVRPVVIQQAPTPGASNAGPAAIESELWTLQ